MRVNSVPLIKFLRTMTAPATVTESVGLPADPAFGAGRRSVVKVFAHHFNNFIMTRQLLHLYPDSSFIQFHLDMKPIVFVPGRAKTSSTATLTATQLYHRAVMGNSADHVTVNPDNFVNIDRALLPRQFRYQRKSL